MEIARNLDDNSFCCTQRRFDAAGRNPTIHFGPLSTDLRSLFGMGFILICHGFMPPHSKASATRTYRVALTRGNESYKVARMTFDGLRQIGTLQELVPENLKALSKGCAVHDPLALLMARYPARREVLMIGNQTVREFALSELRAALAAT